MYYYTATIIGARSRALRGENCFATKIHREYEKYSVYALSHNDDDDDAYLQTRGARARAIAPRVCRFVVEKRTRKKKRIAASSDYYWNLNKVPNACWAYE